MKKHGTTVVFTVAAFFVENGIYYIYYSGIGYPKGPNSSQGVGLTYGPSVKNIHGYDA